MRKTKKVTKEVRHKADPEVRSPHHQASFPTTTTTNRTTQGVVIVGLNKRERQEERWMGWEIRVDKDVDPTERSQ